MEIPNYDSNNSDMSSSYVQLYPFMPNKLLDC